MRLGLPPGAHRAGSSGRAAASAPALRELRAKSEPSVRACAGRRGRGGDDQAGGGAQGGCGRGGAQGSHVRSGGWSGYSGACGLRCWRAWLGSERLQAMSGVRERRGRMDRCAGAHARLLPDGDHLLHYAARIRRPLPRRTPQLACTRALRPLAAHPLSARPLTWRPRLPAPPPWRKAPRQRPGVRGRGRRGMTARPQAALRPFPRSPPAAPPHLRLEGLQVLRRLAAADELDGQPQRVHHAHHRAWRQGSAGQGHRLGGHGLAGTHRCPPAAPQRPPPPLCAPPPPPSPSATPPRAVPSSLVRMRPLRRTASLNSRAWLSMLSPVVPSSTSSVSQGWAGQGGGRGRGPVMRAQRLAAGRGSPARPRRQGPGCRGRHRPRSAVARRTWPGSALLRAVRHSASSSISLQCHISVLG
jgi:hypothetical protein